MLRFLSSSLSSSDSFLDLAFAFSKASNSPMVGGFVGDGCAFFQSIIFLAVFKSIF
jgi:hypothetical protein